MYDEYHWKGKLIWATLSGGTYAIFFSRFVIAQLLSIGFLIKLTKEVQILANLQHDSNINS